MPAGGISSTLMFVESDLYTRRVTLNGDMQYSKAVIEQMKARHSASRPEMTWLEMDVLDMKFEDEPFDLVIDKGECISLAHPGSRGS